MAGIGREQGERDGEGIIEIIEGPRTDGFISVPYSKYVSYQGGRSQCALPDSRTFLSGENVIDNTASAWQSKGSRRRLPLSASQTQIVPSLEHVAILVPSKEYATQLTQ